MSGLAVRVIVHQ